MKRALATILADVAVFQAPETPLSRVDRIRILFSSTISCWLQLKHSIVQEEATGLTVATCPVAPLEWPDCPYQPGAWTVSSYWAKGQRTIATATEQLDHRAVLLHCGSDTGIKILNAHQIRMQRRIGNGV